MGAVLYSNIKFLSFHHYVHTGEYWDATPPTNSLYQASVNPTNGVEAQYQQVEGFIRSSSMSKTTPIYMTEYNTSTTKVTNGTPVGTDCCRSDQVYGPLWNAMAITDLFNASPDTYEAQRKVSANQLPDRMLWFNWSAPTNDFCLFGTNDASTPTSVIQNVNGGQTTNNYGPSTPLGYCNMNLADSQVGPYPQYYAFKLFSSFSTIDINNNGYMVEKPVFCTGSNPCTATTTPSDLHMGAAFTMPTNTANEKDEVFVVNTGSTTYNLSFYVIDPGASHKNVDREHCGR